MRGNDGQNTDAEHMVELLGDIAACCAVLPESALRIDGCATHLEATNSSIAPAFLECAAQLLEGRRLACNGHELTCATLTWSTLL